MKSFLSINEIKKRFESPVNLFKFLLAGMLVVLTFSFVLLIAQQSISTTIDEISKNFGIDNNERPLVAQGATREVKGGSTTYSKEFGVCVDETKLDSNPVQEWITPASNTGTGEIDMMQQTFTTFEHDYTVNLNITFSDAMKVAMENGRVAKLNLHLSVGYELWYGDLATFTKGTGSTQLTIFGTNTIIAKHTSSVNTSYERDINISVTDYKDGFTVKLYSIISGRTNASSKATNKQGIYFHSVIATLTPTYTLPSISITSNNTSFGEVSSTGIESGKIKSMLTVARGSATPKLDYYFTGWSGNTTELSSTPTYLALAVKTPNLISSSIASLSYVANFTSIPISNNYETFIYNGLPQGPQVTAPSGYTATNYYKLGSAGNWDSTGSTVTHKDAITQTDTYYYHYAILTHNTTGEQVGRTAERRFLITKADPTFTNVALVMNYGQSLNDVATDYFSKYTVTLGSTTVTGTFTWTNPTYKPEYNLTNADNFAFTFTPNDATNYKSKSGALTRNQITINKGKLVISDDITTGTNSWEVISKITYGTSLNSILEKMTAYYIFSNEYDTSNTKISGTRYLYLSG
ncbi:MAG: hypothetical protein LBE09_07220, partial [Christensenellaceae bacterium]|nr:hypothetical protein [Christensenellaceae bacterium]